LRTQRVIDRRGLDLAWPGGRGEQQQRQAIRPAGDRDADFRGRRDKRVEVGGETGDEFWLRGDALDLRHCECSEAIQVRCCRWIAAPPGSSPGSSQ